MPFSPYISYTDAHAEGDGERARIWNDINGTLGCYIRGYGAFPAEREVGSNKKKSLQRNKETRGKKRHGKQWIIICPTLYRLVRYLFLMFLYLFLHFFPFLNKQRKEANILELILMSIITILFSVHGGHWRWLAQILPTVSDSQQAVVFAFINNTLENDEKKESQNDLARENVTQQSYIDTYISLLLTIETIGYRQQRSIDLDDDILKSSRYIYRVVIDSIFIKRLL